MYYNSLETSKSPAVPALDLLLVHVVTVDGQLVLIKGVDGLLDELADLSLTLQQAGVPDLTLEYTLGTDLLLPVLVHNLCQVDILYLRLLR